MSPEDPKSEKHHNVLALADSHKKLVVASGHEQFLDDQEDAIDLREYWRIIIQHKTTIIVFTLIALLTSFISTSQKTPIYKSTATLQIERQGDRIHTYQGVVPDTDTYSYDFYETQYELLKSRTLAKRVVDDLGLTSASELRSQKKDSFLRDLKASLSNLFSDNQPETTAAPKSQKSTPEQLAGALKSGLSVIPIKDSRLVAISYDSPVPEMAAKIVNAYANSFISMSQERYIEASSSAKILLNEQIKQTRADLEDSERRLIEYSGERGIVDLDEKLSTNLQQLQSINNKLAAVESNRISAQAAYQEMKAVGAMGFSQVNDSPLIQSYKESLAELETEYAEKLKIFKPAYPAMIQLKEQITGLKNRINEEANNIQSAVGVNYKAAVREEALLKERMNEIKEEILALRKRSTDYQALKRDVDTNLILYEGLLQRAKEVGVAAGTNNNNIYVVDAGEIPGSPYTPNLEKNLMIALMLGLMGGIGLAFLFEYLDDTVKSSEDLEQLTELPVVGVVPEVDIEQFENDKISLLTHSDPTSAIAEAYRSFRTALTFSSAGGHPKILHVSSAGSSEGKTTTAISTAVTFVQAGARVLLLDCDLRSPSLHKEFSVANEIGLTNFLTGEFKLGEIAQKSHVKNLWLLLAGPIPPNPAELLSSGKMVELLDIAGNNYDVVIIDSPPLLGLADALVLSSLATATVLVVDAGVTRKGVLEGALKRLRGINSNIIGTVLTKYGQGRSRYSYDYHYNYRYYGTEDDEDTASTKQLAS
ncbi:MAG: polysaccharide biosynthesis tyrosine autokinase [Gammaproteobacteria bacterium]|nr:MAG: polysaccharide biosynthesis tyrosine autokinase [Gammaproteobacteria bacterium]